MKKLSLIGVLAAFAALAVMAVGAQAAFAYSEFQAKAGEEVAGITIEGEGGTAVFETENKSTVTCEHSESEGEVINAFEASVTVTYYGKCTLAGASAGNGECSNTRNSGEIETELLTVQPGEGVSGSERGLRFTSASGVMAEFECQSGVTIQVTGALVCESRGENVAKEVYLETGEVVCESGTKAGEQLYTSIEVDGTLYENQFLEAEGKVLFIKTNEKDQQDTTETLKYSKPVRQS